ncbi:phage virion morphogenesis protein [Melioribacter sp. OK-6-Me]|uniref:phage virion morphogenesis protein n=1 Tax=unclassified Melioribacter TaxID=2627329 RepID=UPI003ED87107
MADNLEQINALIDSIKERFLPNRKLMTAIAEEMYASVINEFRTQGAGSGGWKALKPATLKQKRRKGFAEAILQARGNLLRSIQSSATESTAVVSTNLRYAAIHHFGGTISIAARTRTLFHRTDKKGNLLKQQTNKNLLIFAKKSHKQKSAYTFGQHAYNISIPARPFMILTEPYKNNIINIIKRHINGVK